MDYVENIKAELAEYIDQEKAEFLPRFFNAYSRRLWGRGPFPGNQGT